MNEKDYVIVKQKEDKPFLARVNSITKESIEITLEKNVHRERKVMEIGKKDIILRLGASPQPGQVYGCDVSNLYRKGFSHEDWGTIYCFTHMEKETLKTLRNSLDHSAQIIKKMGLGDYFETFSLELRAAKGKYAGMYKHSKDENVQSQMHLYPEKCQNAAETMTYCLLHEFGHVIRFNGLTSKKAQNRWLRMFHQSIKPDLIAHKDLMSLLKDVKQAKKEDDAVGFQEALKNLAAEDEEVGHRTKILLRWFKQIHHLSPKDLSTMWEAEDLDQITGLWPTVAIDSSKLAPLVTEYATVNSEELFAESFAFHAQKKKLPANVTALMDKSLGIIKANKPA